MFISGECSWRREPVGGGHIQAGRVGDHGLAHHLGRPAPPRGVLDGAACRHAQLAAPLRIGARQESPTPIIVACLINSHSQSELPEGKKVCGLCVLYMHAACVLSFVCVA